MADVEQGPAVALQSVDCRREVEPRPVGEIGAEAAKALRRGAAEDSTGEGSEALSVMAASIAIAPSEAYPRISRLGDELLSGTGAERFSWGLDVLINGILDTPRDTPEVRGAQA